MEIERKRQMKYGTKGILLTVSILVSSILLYGILDKKHIRWDLTANKELSLSDQTEKVLKGLSQKVQITAFFRKGEDLEGIFTRRKVDDVLREYASHSRKVEYRMVDPDSEIGLAAQYSTTTDGTIVFQAGKNRKEIYKSQLFDYRRMDEKGGEETLPEFAGEGLFTNALLKVIREKQTKICLLQGHGERGTEETSPEGFNQAKGTLSKNNYEVPVLSLVTETRIPKDCTLVLIAGPKESIPPPEDQLIKGWIKKGGRLLLLAEPMTPPPLPETLEFLKVNLHNDLVLDPKRHFLLGPQYPAPILADHEITKDLQQTNPVLFSARSLSFSEKEEEIEPILTTTPEAWGETNLSGKEPKFDKDKDRKGPLVLGVAIGKSSPVAVVVGDADFVSNGLIQAPGNLDLFLNMVAWLAGEKELISIRPQTPEFRNITLTAARARFIATFTQLVYPLLVLGIGGVYWFRRRNA